MKLKISTFVLTVFVFLTCCGPKLYSKKELRTQIIPTALQNKIWTLRKIYSEKILNTEYTAEFNNSNGTENCTFLFQFAEKGELIMTFKGHTFTGFYLVSGDRFKLIYNGFREKIVWTSNPECKINPEKLGYVFNWREFEFKIHGQELTLKDKTGNSFVLTAGR